VISRLRLNVFDHRRSWYIFSATIIVAGLLSLGVRGLNAGLDFTGGTELHLQFDESVSVAQVREKLEPHGLGQASVVTLGQERREVLIRSSSLPEGDEREDIYASLKELAEFEILGLDEVSPTISAELKKNALIALTLAALGMVAYITIRFEFKFAGAAIIALLHDAAVTLGVFSLIGARVDTAFIAAILTTLGYSINDTIIIFDRIRENLRYHSRKESIRDLVNTSVSQVLVRSINTSVTTLLTVVALIVFGGPTIREFALALLIGILSGTYSSIFIAAPVWGGWEKQGSLGRR